MRSVYKMFLGPRLVANPALKQPPIQIELKDVCLRLLTNLQCLLSLSFFDSKTLSLFGVDAQDFPFSFAARCGHDCVLTNNTSVMVVMVNLMGHLDRAKAYLGNWEALFLVCLSGCFWK